MDDGKVFRLADTWTLAIPGLDMPIDLAPAVSETSNPTLASNSTLAGGSDFYVVNRGNGTIMRVRQDRTVLAVRQVMAEGRALGAEQLNGIGVSPDAQQLWVTVSGPLPGHGDAPGGALLEVAAFGPGRAASLGTPDGPQPARALAERGRVLFQTSFSPADGRGPLFNGRSCLECHAVPVAGGVAPEGAGFVLRVGRLQNAVFDALPGQGGPVARAYSVASGSAACGATPGVPAAANVTSVRSAAALFGLGLIEAVPDEAILELAARPGQRGRANTVRGPDGRERPGRFGWKADTATLEQFVADAFRNEIGITSPLAPVDLVAAGPDCGWTVALKDDGGAIRAVTAYLRSLPPLLPTGPATLAGQAVFAGAGCDVYHRLVLSGRNGEAVPLYSDLLLHDLGPGLNDGVVQADAGGAEWRTTPLWGLHARSRFLHDGRATSVADAILAHDGEGVQAAQSFRALLPAERQSLLSFLDAI